MTTPETRNEHTASVPRAADPTGLDTIVPSYVTGLVIIGLALSFLVVLIGFVSDRFAVMIAGSFALSAVTIAWAIAAAIGLWKSVRDWLASRRADRSEATDTKLSR